MVKRGRPRALKAEEKEVPLPESIDPASGRMVKQTKSATLSARLQESEHGDMSPHKSLSRKQMRLAACTYIRRSQRLTSLGGPNLDKSIEQVIKEVTVSDSEKEEEPTTDDEENVAEPEALQKSLEDRVTSVEEELEELQSTVEELKSKDSQMPESARAADVSYKSLYFDSQKKIEALTNANHQLALKMEYALGKLEVYEKSVFALSEGLHKMKDVVLISNLTGVTDTPMNVSPQAMRNESLPSGNTGAKTATTKKGRPAAK